MTKKIVLIIPVYFGLFTLIHTYPVWTRYPGGFWIPLIGLLIAGGFIWLIVKLIKEVRGLIRNRRSLATFQLVPALLITALLCFTFLNTFSFDLEDAIYGKVIFRACYEGTQNQSTFKLREGNRFEIHWTGVFFYDEYFTGTYEQMGDTLVLNYHSDKPRRVGDELYMDNQKGLLTTIKRENDSLRNVVSFYYGYCKGLN